MAVRDFEKYCTDNSLEIEVLISDDSTHTARDAAARHGVEISAIVKSILTIADGKPILFLVPGDQRLNLDDISSHLEITLLNMGNASEVKDITGYSIGGVPPFGHKQKLKTYYLDRFPEDGKIVAAAGHPNAVFYTTLVELIRLSDADRIS